MTHASTFKLLTAAAATIAGSLLLADIPEAQARTAGLKSATTGSSSADGYTPKTVIRDHRKNPQPWTLPPHYHRHDHHRRDRH